MLKVSSLNRFTERGIGSSSSAPRKQDRDLAGRGDWALHKPAAPFPPSPAARTSGRGGTRERAPRASTNQRLGPPGACARAHVSAQVRISAARRLPPNVRPHLRGGEACARQPRAARPPRPRQGRLPTLQPPPPSAAIGVRPPALGGFRPSLPGPWPSGVRRSR